MTVKAGEGEAAERKRRLKLLLPHLWCCLLCCAAQQWQKCLAGASSNNDASVHASSPLAGMLGNQISSSATLSSSLTNKSKKKLVSNNNKCQTHDDLFCLLCFSSPQKIWDYSTHGESGCRSGHISMNGCKIFLVQIREEPTLQKRGVKGSSQSCLIAVVIQK